MSTRYLYPSDFESTDSVYSSLVAQNHVDRIVEERDNLDNILTAVRRSIPRWENKWQ